MTIEYRLTDIADQLDNEEVDLEEPISDAGHTVGQGLAATMREGASEIARLRAELEEARTERDSYRARKDGAYEERNRLVAVLTVLFPSRLSWHSDTDEEWDPEWRSVVYIDLPTGQVSWHIHDSQFHLFPHLERAESVWDGHDTGEKYRRVSAFVAARAEGR